MDQPPILQHKHPSEPSVFRPENLLREARRQLGRPAVGVPATVILDPDGDLADYAVASLGATREAGWACYHSQMLSLELAGRRIGIVPRVVGAPFAVLVAEQLFASGCHQVISITSAGVLNPLPVAKDFALITSAVRDEGTSYHYLPATAPAGLADGLRERLMAAELSPDARLFHPATSWTTDAPYRETQTVIDRMRAQGVTCVEMEAAALYAFAAAQGRPVICLAHLTNTMATNEGDFEKGEHAGSLAALAVLRQVLDLLG
jgi:uridine phosphorylase